MKSHPPSLETTAAPSLALTPIDESHAFTEITSMVMDPTGKRVAFTFKNEKRVALYDLIMRPLPDLSPM
jgi:hypothetical protein